jgi:hypothetical protein
MRKKQLLTYGLLAGAGYLIYKHMQTTAAPAVVVAAPAQPAVAGFGHLGYYPDGSDRPFQPGPRRGMAWRGRET